MYHPSETRHEHRHESLQESEHYPTYRGTVTRPHTRLRVVRVPGGFAYLEDRPTTRGDLPHTPA